jgi:hypothetical protein
MYLEFNVLLTAISCTNTIIIRFDHLHYYRVGWQRQIYDDISGCRSAHRLHRSTAFDSESAKKLPNIRVTSCWTFVSDTEITFSLQVQCGLQYQKHITNNSTLVYQVLTFERQEISKVYEDISHLLAN